MFSAKELLSNQPQGEAMLGWGISNGNEKFSTPSVEGHGPEGNCEALRSTCIHACPVKLSLCGRCSISVIFLTLCWETKPTFLQPHAQMCYPGVAGDEENPSGKLREQQLAFDKNFFITLYMDIVFITIVFI